MLLDEAANIVRWKDLPKQYSHFGSRGIVVMTVLQSWAQGVRCWGREGMEALWSAANIKVLGSGLDDDSFLRGRSEMVGQHYELTTSVSRGRGGEKSSNTSRVTETTLTASDLGAMPRGRAVVFTAGHRATLVRTVPWMERGYHQQITDAIAQVQQSLTSATPAERRLRVVPVDTEQEQKSA
jgi:type IV secretory pathway TraG/TraD family ATPase VirD4